MLWDTLDLVEVCALDLHETGTGRGGSDSATQPTQYHTP